MATTFFEGIEIGNRSVPAALERSVAYVIDPAKTDHGSLVSSFQCEAQSAAQEMYLHQQEAEQATGRSVKQNGSRKSYCAMWMRQSFAPGEVTPELAHSLGIQLAKEVLGDKYQFVVATHIDTHCIHNHIIFNVVGADYKKFHQDKYTPDRVARISDRLCRAHGLSVIEEPKKERPGLHHPGQKHSSFRDTLRTDVERCASQAKSWEDFLSLMSENYYIFQRGKNVSFRHRTNGQQRNIRLASLGYGFDEETLRKKIGDFTRADTCPLFREPNPHSYSAKLREVKSKFAAMDAMDQQHVSSQSDYLTRLTELRTEEKEILSNLKNARIHKDSAQEEKLQKRMDEIRQERKELIRMRAAVGKEQRGDEEIDR